jgi:uncharacterized protein YegJ (DUF2314 family)
MFAQADGNSPCPKAWLRARTRIVKTFINSLTSNWNIAILFLGLAGWGSYILASVSHAAVMWGMFALYAAVIAGMMLRWQWARKLGIALLLWLAVGKLHSLATREFTWNRLLHAGALGFVAYGLWKKPGNGIFDDFNDADEADGNDDAEADAKPIISLVHLRSQQRYLEAPVLANALSAAWNLKIIGGEAGDVEQSDGFVAGESPIFIVMVQKPVFAMFMVHNHERSYFDEPAEVAERVPNLRFAQIIREHSAWLAVDLMQVKDGQLDQDEAYRLIGKAISALVDDQVMAIMCPQHQFFNLWSAELEEILCGDAPLKALQEEVKAPVIGVPDGDTIANAIAEARRRWPEFVAAFKNRQPDDDRFIVKAPFTGEDDQVEHMWLQVIGLEPEYVHGHLVNDPMHTTRLKKGSQVEVPVAEVSDWVCPDAQDNPIGNFTGKAIQEAAKARREV